MYELHKVGKRTFYIDCPAKMGIYLDGEKDAWLIDSGNDKEAGKKVLKIMEEQGWRLHAVINTHSHADHTGGNRFLQEKTGCPIFALGLECAIARQPLAEPSLLFGGYPPKPLRNKFLMAQPGHVKPLESAEMPMGLACFRLDGHYFDMIGLRTDDNVIFLADCLAGEHLLQKYHINYLYDVAAYLKTLDDVIEMRADWFVPAHAEAVRDSIAPLARLNRQKVQEIAELLLQICRTPATTEEIIKQVFEHHGLSMDWNQYVLVGSTLRSYLAYLHDEGKLTAQFEQNRLLWRCL